MIEDMSSPHRSDEDEGMKPGASGSSVVDMAMLASILMQAWGPIIDSLERAVAKFSGDGTRDVLQWLNELERRCVLEKVGPEEVIAYLLDGNAKRVYDALRVAEASQWDDVKAALLLQYGMSWQEAYRQFTARQLAAGESVDIYVDDLQRLGARCGATREDMFFRVKFIEGLRHGDRQWAVLLPDVYTVGFDTLVSRVRERVAAYRAVAGSKPLSVAAAAASETKPGLSCLRCGGPHRVKSCTQKRRAQAPTKLARVKCFACKDQGHFDRDCPTGSTAGVVGFPKEGVEGGSTTFQEENMEEE